jgi:hypothetical protein
MDHAHVVDVPKTFSHVHDLRLHSQRAGVGRSGRIRVTHVDLSLAGSRWIYASMHPFSIQGLTRQTGNMSETPQNGTMLGWTSCFQHTTSEQNACVPLSEERKKGAI